MAFFGGNTFFTKNQQANPFMAAPPETKPGKTSKQTLSWQPRPRPNQEKTASKPCHGSPETSKQTLSWQPQWYKGVQTSICPAPIPSRFWVLGPLWVKLRLAYRLAFVIYKYMHMSSRNPLKRNSWQQSNFIVKWRFFVQSLNKPLACSISWNVKLHRVACSPDRRIAFITEVPNTVQAVASRHYKLSKSWNNVLDSRL